MRSEKILEKCYQEIEEFNQILNSFYGDITNEEKVSITKACLTIQIANKILKDLRKEEQTIETHHHS